MAESGDDIVDVTDEMDSGSSTSKVVRTPLAATGRRSAVWAFFSIPDSNNKDQVKCDLCNTDVKTKDSNTSNLFNHLKHNHPIRHAEVQGCATQSTSTRTPKSTKMRSAIDDTDNQPTITDSFLSRTPYRKDSDRAKILTSAVTNYIISGW